MKTIKGLRFRSFAVITLMLSVTILGASPIASASGGKSILLCTKGKNVLKVIGIDPKCPKGYKKSPIQTPGPKPKPIPTPTPTPTGIYLDASGNYTGPSIFQDLSKINPSCTTDATGFTQALTLQEGSGGKITGNFTNGLQPRTISGIRDGNTITVTMQTPWGSRGPYIWQLNGNAITGSIPLFCYDVVGGPILAEGTQTFTVTRL